ncbi:phosphotransferase [Lachnoclostridium phytofermentans]|uniref:Mn2+-dependent serine/threonine protein kinase n=1 Tax=Lachnoclostridium phytofermentans (strain ATCC 700394 / DSM 18823 / ISDg) TaxID=357809 RepID=A9KLW5_LACP7|nr:phosphotransferase [Lachnoclostridium phytofermentans]ABX44274.1 Mn2+-dependent serine/threonine protein kinase [Lachnoclostridium phytofermentans ISDg]
MKLTNLISKGQKASVYRDGDNAIKVFNKETNKTDVLNEALNTTRVEETGLAIPSISEVGIENGQWSITMNFIEGKTLSQLIKENPEKKEEYINKMVDLQLEIHSKRAPLLNKLKDKLIRQINSLEMLDSIKKYDLLTRLDGMPKHVKVCHGDLNPNNIIVSNDNMYVIDWVHATQGNASADTARTYLLFALEDQRLADYYLDVFCKKSKTEKRYVQTWLPIVAAAQLSKDKPEEKDLLMKWLDVVEYE